MCNAALVNISKTIVQKRIVQIVMDAWKTEKRTESIERQEIYFSKYSNILPTTASTIQFFLLIMNAFSSYLVILKIFCNQTLLGHSINRYFASETKVYLLHRSVLSTWKISNPVCSLTAYLWNRIFSISLYWLASLSLYFCQRSGHQQSIIFPNVIFPFPDSFLFLIAKLCHEGVYFSLSRFPDC